MKDLLKLIVLCALVFGMFGTRSKVDAHCQVPCGIYNDAGRITHMLEDTTTIAKAISEISSIAGSHKAADFNQLIRWINTKEEHASNIIKVVSEYFLTQKVKPVAEGDPEYNNYLKQLAAHHSVLRAAMKTKQTVDPAAATELEAAIKNLSQFYPAKK